MSKLVIKGSLTARYCAVLEELRIEALQHVERPLNWPLAGPAGACDANSNPVDPGESTFYNGSGTNDSHCVYENSLMGISNWAQFESLVRFLIHPLCAARTLTPYSRLYPDLGCLTQFPTPTLVLTNYENIFGADSFYL